MGSRPGATYLSSLVFIIDDRVAQLSRLIGICICQALGDSLCSSSRISMGMWGCQRKAKGKAHHTGKMLELYIQRLSEEALRLQSISLHLRGLTLSGGRHGCVPSGAKVIKTSHSPRVGAGTKLSLPRKVLLK